MLRKAFFRAFFFLLLMVTLTSPAFAFVGGENIKGVPSDSQAPLSNGMTWFVRRVPVLLYNPNSVTASLEGNKGEISLSDVDLVWGELWTKPGWAQEGSRYGLNELYIPINSNMTPAPASGTKKVILPDADLDDPDVVNFLADYFDVLPQVRYIDKGNAWAGDASSGIFVNVPMPSREEFLAQEAGMNDSLAAKWKPYLANKAYSDGLIPSADGSTQYLRALDAFDHGATFYYHLLLNPGPQTGNWQVAAETTPYYDENAPDGTGFYRGKDWSDQLKSSPASVPGFIGAITPWANLKLEGPVEITGAPGEEKEAHYTITNESSADLAPDVAVKREGGAYVTAAAEVPVKAWDKAPVTLKFKVEDRPYRVRVAVNPFKGIWESTYKDNYVDVTVKPIAPDMYVKTLDPGASEAEPGKAYTGTVVYGLAADYPVPVKATLSLTNNGYSVTAADGTPLNDQVPVEFQPGEEKTFTFTWHGDAAGDTLVAKIHPVNPPDDRDWSNNSKEVWVNPAGCDLAVKAWPFIDPIYIGMDTGYAEGGVNIKVTRKDDNPNPVTAKVTVDGPAGRQAYTVTVPPGGSKPAGPYRFRVYSPGTYTVHIEAWPEGLQDAYPPDNVAEVMIHAKQQTMNYYTGPREPGLHVELGG
ncbi:hypothetical protein E308F_17530 [Moorella sp. E308F]|uniref:hypothetical protein n=1 Tax=unclassified Neomoorella TaxID=2676739 RepID=UPI0010FFB7C1|nr:MULTISPECIES: hypothetical protein [unclassified Moorella (in: firmicutes)]GEA15509.1 hypothetical protein E308F_17530 [Moorella sp. E308F]GEA19633.1 hypothetical protein E306M_27710 [Moorella sp. E306M]